MVAYIQTAGLAPRISSATDQASVRGTLVPPSSAGSSSRNHSASTKAWYDRLNPSGIRTECVAGSNTGGCRSASANDSATRAGGQPVDLVQDAARGLLVHLGERLAPQQVLAPQHLEQVELDVPEVALEVTHRGPPRRRRQLFY